MGVVHFYDGWLSMCIGLQGEKTHKKGFLYNYIKLNKTGVVALKNKSFNLELPRSGSDKPEIIISFI